MISGSRGKCILSSQRISARTEYSGVYWHVLRFKFKKNKDVNLEYINQFKNCDQVSFRFGLDTSTNDREAGKDDTKLNGTRRFTQRFRLMILENFC